MLRSVRFGLLRKGEYIGVTAVLNMHTKFAKLSVGKHVVSARRHGSQDQLFPLIIALNGLAPLSKVWIDFLPLPKNTFVIRINDADIYSLTKEEVDYDPSKTESMSVVLKVNDKETISRPTPWIIDEFEEKIQGALGMDHLNSLEISELSCKSWVANDFVDLLIC